MYELTLFTGRNKDKNKVYKNDNEKETIPKYFLLGVYFINRLLFGHRIMINYEFDIKKYQKIVFLDFSKYKIENYILNYKSLHVKEYIQKNDFIIKNKTFKEYKKYIKKKIYFDRNIFNKQLKLKQANNDYELIRKIDQYNDYYKNISCVDNIIKYIDNINIKEKLCPICGENIKKNKLLITDCGHVFCLDCFLPWSENNNKCPECRKNLNIYQLTHILDIKNRDKLFESYKINYLVKFLGTKLTFVVKYIYDNQKKNQILFLSKNENILNIVSIILKQFNIQNSIYPEFKEKDNNIILLNYVNLKKKLVCLKKPVVIFNEPPKNYDKEMEILKTIFSYNLNSIDSIVKFIIRGTKEEKLSLIYN